MVRISTLSITFGISVLPISRFVFHFNSVYGKSLRVLGFVKRTCSNFNDALCMKVLYCSLIRSLLEYESVLWNTNQSGLVNKLEKIQKHFLRFYAFKTN